MKHVGRSEFTSSPRSIANRKTVSNLQINVVGNESRSVPPVVSNPFSLHINLLPLYPSPRKVRGSRILGIRVQPSSLRDLFRKSKTQRTKGDSMKSIATVFVLIVVAGLSACGGGSGGGGNNGGGGSAAQMQAGQWEFHVVQNDSGYGYYLEANIVDSGDGIFSTSPNTTEYCGEIGSPAVDPGMTLSAAFSGDALTGSILASNDPGVSTTFSATVASDGKSVSAGTISASDLVCAWSGTGSSNNGAGGTFSGYTVAPINGTFVGTLSGDGSPDQVSMTISQDANFGITASGTVNQAGTVSALVITPEGNIGGVNEIVGAQIQASGTIAGGPFTLIGQSDPQGDQLSVFLVYGTEREGGTLLLTGAPAAGKNK
jgi:hypothetical protein